MYVFSLFLPSSVCSANQPPNLTVLANTTASTPTGRQPKSAVALYAVNASGPENSDLMIRLRESIKQKEEFLKSPLPSGVLSASASASGGAANGNAAATQSSPQSQAQHFFPSHTPPGGGGGNVAATRVRHQVLIKQPQQPQHPQHHHPHYHQQQQQVVLGYDMYNSYVGNKLVSRPLGAMPMQQQQQQQHHLQQHPQQRQVAVSVANNNAKYAKELDYFETLQETGVTNKV